MEPLLIVTDLLLLLFWVRLWLSPDHELYFNPFLSAPTRLTDAVLGFLRPVLPLPGRLTALIVLAFFLAFRAVVLNHFAAAWPWTIHVGAFIVFTPHTPGLPGAMVFSLLDFLFFVARFWGLYLLIQLLTPVLRHDRASQAVHCAALPLSALRWWAQVLLLVVVHALLTYQLTRVGVPNVIMPDGTPPVHLLGSQAAPLALALQHGWLAALSIADSLHAAYDCMLVLIVGSFVGMLLQNPALMAIGNEGVAVLLGRFTNRLTIGMFDLTPILYFLGVSFIYGPLCLAILHLMSLLRFA